MHRHRHAFLPIVMLMLATAACAGGASPSPAAPTGGSGGVDSPEAAAAAVMALDTRFEGFEARDPDMIGGCCWYEATEIEGGYQVVMHVGWGDCPAGCINKHTWTFAVTPDGEVGLVGESGDPVPPGDFPPSDALGDY